MSTGGVQTNNSDYHETKEVRKVRGEKVKSSINNFFFLLTMITMNDVYAFQAFHGKTVRLFSRSSDYHRLLH